MAWSANDVPSLTGRTAVVTGANSGIGFEAARVLVRRGAHVVLACRDPAKAEGALRAIRQETPAAGVEILALDLASLASVREFAAAFCRQHATLDLLCNNAGVMALPYMETADGFEMQFGTNHLGHFTLTALLLEPLLAAPAARVVTVSSNAHRIGRLNLPDPNTRQGYGRWTAYGQSKLANLLFAYELQRRLDAAGVRAVSLACHPGYAATNLSLIAPRLDGSAWMERIMHLGNRILAQDAAMGALPTVYAATSPDARGGEYIGPSGPGEIWGPPRRVRSNRRSQERDTAEALWRLSEELTKTPFAIRPA